jgi:hypothetical protein
MPITGLEHIPLDKEPPIISKSPGILWFEFTGNKPVNLSVVILTPIQQSGNGTPKLQNIPANGKNMSSARSCNDKSTSGLSGVS